MTSQRAARGNTETQHKHHNSPVVIACAILAAAIVPLGSHAQTQSGEATLGEVNVSTQASTSKDQLPAEQAGGQVAKGSRLGVLGNTDIMDAPFEVTSYTSKLIADQQAKTVASVLYNDPSIRFTTSDGHTVENMMIRGFDVSSTDYAYNGLYGLLSTGHVNTFMLERVEVFKGPSAMTSGISPSGGVGGVINLVPKRAGDEPLTRLTASYESDSRLGLAADIGRRFGEEKRLGIRVNGNYASGKRSTEDQKQYNRDESIAIDYRGDRWKVEFDAYSTKQRNGNGLPALFQISSAGKVLATPDASLNQNRGLYLNESTQGASIRGEVELNDNITAYAALGAMKDDYYGSRYSTHVMSIKADGSGTVRAFLQDGRNSSYSGETGVRARFETGPVKHSLVASASAFHDHSLSTTYINTGDTNIYNPTSGVSYSTSGRTSTSNTENTFTSFALADTLSFLDDKTLLTLGLRQQRVRTNNKISGVTYDEDATTPAVGLVVKPWAVPVSLYANYIEGLSAGSTVSDTDYANYGETLAPYKSKQAEIGIKWDAGTIIHTISLFQIKRPLEMAVTRNNLQYLEYAGEQRNRGIEWSFAGEAFPGIRVLGGLAYTKGKYTKSDEVQGQTAAGIPDWTATLGTDFDIPGVAGLAANARMIYSGRQYLMTNSTLELPSWTRFDAGARYATRIAGKNVVFRANIENIFDRSYWSGVFSTSAGLTTIGNPRTYKLSATVDF